jgi:hypothetical protein
MVASVTWLAWGAMLSIVSITVEKSAEMIYLSKRVCKFISTILYRIGNFSKQLLTLFCKISHFIIENFFSVALKRFSLQKDWVHIL